MSHSFAAEIWHELKRYVNTVDRTEAAETMVNVMIDNDVDPEDIKTSFRGDTDIRRALNAYLDSDKDESADEEIEEDEDYEDDY